MNASERLKIIRGDLTQAEFAAKLGIHKNTLGRYERGESEPDFSVCVNICSIFGVSPNWLLLGAGPVRESDVREQAFQPEMPAAIPRMQDMCPRCARLETKLESLDKDFREVIAENRQLHREKEEILRENGVLREKIARLEERKSRLAVASDQSAQNSGVA